MAKPTKDNHIPLKNEVEIYNEVKIYFDEYPCLIDIDIVIDRHLESNKLPIIMYLNNRTYNKIQMGLRISSQTNHKGRFNIYRNIPIIKNIDQKADIIFRS